MEPFFFFFFDAISLDPSRVWAGSVSEEPVDQTTNLKKTNKQTQKQASTEHTYRRAWGLKTVKGIYAYICCIAAYNSALPKRSGARKRLRELT